MLGFFRTTKTRNPPSSRRRTLLGVEVLEARWVMDGSGGTSPLPPPMFPPALTSGSSAYMAYHQANQAAYQSYVTVANGFGTSLENHVNATNADALAQDAAAYTVYTQSATSAVNTYMQQLSQAGTDFVNAYDAAKSQIIAAYTSAVAGFNSTITNLANGLQNSVDAYTTTLAALDTTIAPLNSQLDATLAQIDAIIAANPVDPNDASAVAALEALLAPHWQTVATLNANIDSAVAFVPDITVDHVLPAVDGAFTQIESAINSADAAWDTAIEAAHQTYINTATAAYNIFVGSEASAWSLYQSERTNIEANQLALLQSAVDTYNGGINAAYATYLAQEDVAYQVLLAADPVGAAAGRMIMPPAVGNAILQVQGQPLPPPPPIPPGFPGAVPPVQGPVIIPVPLHERMQLPSQPVPLEPAIPPPLVEAVRAMIRLQRDNRHLLTQLQDAVSSHQESLISLYQSQTNLEAVFHDLNTDPWTRQEITRAMELNSQIIRWHQGQLRPDVYLLGGVETERLRLTLPAIP